MLQLSDAQRSDIGVNMWTPYNELLNKQRKRLRENPYLRYANQMQSNLAHPYQQLQQNYMQRANSGQMTEGALADISMKQQQQFINNSRSIYDEANMRQQERKDQIQGNIDQLEFQNNLYIHQENERKKAEKKAKKDAWLNVGLQAGGAILGAATGGLGWGATAALTGAKLGAAAGGIAGGIATNNPQIAMQGFMDTLGGLSSMATLNSEKAAFEKMKEIEWDLLSTSEIAKISSFIGSGNQHLRNQGIDEAISLTNKYKELNQSFRTSNTTYNNFNPSWNLFNQNKIGNNFYNLQWPKNLWEIK